MLENIRNAARYLWNHKAATGVTVVAISVASTLTTKGVHDVVLDSGASSAVAVGVSAVAFIAVTVPYAYTRFSALAEMFGGGVPDERDHINFSGLKNHEKIVAGAVGLVGTATATITVVAVDKALAVAFFGNSPDTLVHSFQLTPLTAGFAVGILAYGYNFFLKNTCELSRHVSWSALVEAYRSPNVGTKVAGSLASLVYLAVALGLTQPLYNFLLENVPASIALASFAAVADAITYLGQLNHHREIAEEAFNDSSYSRVTLGLKSAALLASVTFNSMANYGTLGAVTDITALRVAGGGVGALVQNGLFNVRIFKRLPRAVQVEEVSEESGLIQSSSGPRLGNHSSDEL